MYEMADQSWRSQPMRMSREIIALTCERIAEHASAHSLSSVTLILHGGEPLLAGPDLLSYAVTTLLASLGRATKGQVCIQTNGVLLDAAFLKLFDELEVSVGVSLDGDADAHDRHRRRANGQGSYAAVAASLEQLTSAPFKHLFSGLLCTIDPRNPPIGTYEALLRFRPPSIDFLLPHGNWATPPPGRLTGSKQTPYGDWLVTVFDRWYHAPRRETRIRMFGDVINLLLGGQSGVETIGRSPAGAVTIETDGSIEQADSLKSAYQGASATGLHVRRDSFDDMLRKPEIAAAQIAAAQLSAQCNSCRIREICGGGLYAHRYDPSNGFSNPSVYCPDLQRIIHHIRRAVAADVGAIVKRS